MRAKAPAVQQINTQGQSIKASRLAMFLQEMRKHGVLYIMFIPVAIYFIIFAYFPMAGIVMAFKDFNYRQGIFFSPWNGLDNFHYFFVSGKAWLVTKNTIMYNLVFLGTYTVFSIAAAIFLSEIYNKWFKRLAQTFMFLPYFISWVTVSAFVYNFLNYEYGIVNVLLKKLVSRHWIFTRIRPTGLYCFHSYTFGNGLVMDVSFIWQL